jgi:hypothetical protein
MKKKTVSKLKKELDALYSKYIRNKYAVNGRVKCYTCPKVGEVKEMQNGHFVPRQYLKTRWDDRNCRPQCYACNMLYNGQPSAFANNLKKEYGENIIAELERDRMKPVKLEVWWYEEQIAHYKSLL